MDGASRQIELWTDTLMQLIRLARAMTEVQRPVALDGLTDRVGFVCAKVIDLPPDDGRAVRPRLLALLAELDSLGTALRDDGPEPPGFARAGRA